MRAHANAAPPATRRRLPVLLAACLATAASATLAQNSAPTEVGVPPPGTLEGLVARAGVQTCLPVARRFGPALAGPGEQSAAMLMTHPAAPDAASFGAVVARDDPNGTSLVSATFAPTLRGGCDMSYDKVDVWRKSCQDVALEELRYGQATKVVGQRVAVIPYSATHHVYLIRIAGGCVSVRKELLYP